MTLILLIPFWTAQTSLSDTFQSIVSHASLFSASTNGQVTIDLEHIFDDDQLDSNMISEKRDEDSINQNLLSGNSLPRHVIPAHIYLVVDEHRTNETHFPGMNASNKISSDVETSPTGG